jgi:hypothetical protein
MHMNMYINVCKWTLTCAWTCTLTGTTTRTWTLHVHVHFHVHVILMFIVMCIHTAYGITWCSCPWPMPKPTTMPMLMPIPILWPCPCPCPCPWTCPCSCPCPSPCLANYSIGISSGIPCSIFSEFRGISRRNSAEVKTNSEKSTSCHVCPRVNMKDGAIPRHACSPSRLMWVNICRRRWRVDETYEEDREQQEWGGQGEREI